MQAGPLRHRIELQQKTTTRDATGGNTLSYSTIVTRWAQITPLRGDERFRASQMEAKTTVKIRIRYYSGLDTTWRVKWGTRYYQIVEIINVGERNYAIELGCKELVEDSP